jgi:hypothetical protein
VRVAVRKAIAGRDALVAQGGFLEVERLGRRTELQVRRAVEPRAEVLQILLDVPERERQGAILWHRAGRAMRYITSPPAARLLQRSSNPYFRTALLGPASGVRLVTTELSLSLNSLSSGSTLARRKVVSPEPMAPVGVAGLP